MAAGIPLTLAQANVLIANVEAEMLNETDDAKLRVLKSKHNKLCETRAILEREELEKVTPIVATPTVKKKPPL